MHVRLLLTASVLSLGLAACGGDSASDSADTSGATAITIEAGDLFFAPETLAVSADGVAITLENIGLVEHNLVIDGVDVEIYVDVAQTVTETVVLAPGSYDFYCSIAGHQAAGMVGVIVAS